MWVKLKKKQKKLLPEKTTLKMLSLIRIDESKMSRLGKEYMGLLYACYCI